MISYPKSIAFLILCAVAALAARPTHAATPAGTAFTYQGRLTEGGSPATGSYDLQFTLKDAASGGATIGSVLARNDVSVQNGIFTTELDFGAGAFNGDARWLVIGVRPGASAGSYTPLSPPQRIRPTPYAVHAAVADVALAVATPPPAPTGGVPQLVRSYPVATGQTIAAGNVVTIDGGQLKLGYATTPLGTKILVSNKPLEPQTLTVAALSASSFIIVYTETDSNAVLRARVGTVSGNTITLGTPATLFTDTQKIGAAVLVKLSATQCVAAWHTTAGKGTTVVVSVSGSTPAPGTPTAIQASGVAALSATVLSATQVVLAWRDGASSDNLSAAIGNISGNLIALAPKATLANYVVGITAVQKIAADKFLIGFNYPMQSSMGYVGLATVSGSTITFIDWPRAFDGMGVQHISLAGMDASRVAIVYESNNEPHPGYSVVVSINGNNLYLSNPQKYDALPTYGRAVPLTASQALVAHVEGNPGPMVFQTGTAAQDGLSLGTRITLNSQVENGNHQLAALTAKSYVTTFFIKNVSNMLGYAMVGNTNAPALLGVARAAGAAGQTIAVTLAPRAPLRGISDTHTGLVAGQYYYAQPGGTVSTYESAVPLGLAISATEILLVDQ